MVPALKPIYTTLSKRGQCRASSRDDKVHDKTDKITKLYVQIHTKANTKTENRKDKACAILSKRTGAYQL